jgi:hypothetical protein
MGREGKAKQQSVEGIPATGSQLSASYPKMSRSVVRPSLLLPPAFADTDTGKIIHNIDRGATLSPLAPLAVSSLCGASGSVPVAKAASLSLRLPTS